MEKRSVAAEEGLHLQQAVVGTAQDRLRLLDRIDLSSAGLLADLIRFSPTTSDHQEKLGHTRLIGKEQLGTVECINGNK